jgi:hypothetical protein
MRSVRPTGPRALLTALLVLALCWLALPAHAKGPTAGAVEGPGLPSPVRITGYEPAGNLPGLGTLAQLTGAQQVFFGAGRNIQLSPRAPAVELGPRYTITFFLPGAGGRESKILTQHAYPFATGGPVTYSVPGRSPFTGAWVGGWFRATDTLTSVLRDLGAVEAAPVAPPADPAAPARNGAGATGPAALVVAALAGGMALAALAAVAVRRRRQAAFAPAGGGTATPP